MRLLSSLLISAVVTLGLIARRRPPRIALEPFPGPLRLAVAAGLLVAVLAVTAFAPLEGLLAEGEGPDLAHASYAALFAGHAVLAGFLVLWWGLAGFEPPERFLHLRPTAPVRKLGLGLIAGLLAWALTIGAMAVAGAVLGVADPSSTGGVDGGRAEDIPDVVRLLVGLSVPRRLLLVVSAGVLEEAFFRSFLQPRAGIIVSSVLFTMSHASYGLPLMLVGVFSISIVLGLVFRAVDDALPCMIAHGVFDGVQLLLVLPLAVGDR